VLHRLRAVRKNDKGFTLTELLIVIVILGVLTGIVVFAVGAFSDRGVKAACSADKRQVQTAVEAYYAKNGSYPANLGALVPAFLREAPSNPQYTISYNSTTGAVTASVTGPPVVEL
jgi:prepilin-type N-terminal cleavage/methylation domain-containing protein